MSKQKTRQQKKVGNHKSHLNKIKNMKPQPLNDNIRHSEGFTGGTMNLKERQQAIKKNKQKIRKPEPIRVKINEILS